MKNLVTVVKVLNESIVFSNGQVLGSEHYQDCCEYHWLCFENLSLEDFEGMQFDLTGDDFFERVKGYGIRLKPVNNFPVPVPGYGSNNGYYSEDLELVLSGGDLPEKRFDITECQDVSG